MNPQKPINPLVFSNEGFGMTLRDYFAAQWMNAYITNMGENAPISYVTSTAYEYADAMLAERERKE